MVEQKELTEESEFRGNLSSLIELSKTRQDDPDERNKRDELLRYFRKRSYVSEEISKFTDGGLTEDSVSRIVKGTDPEDEALEGRIAELLVNMVKADLGFGTVRIAVQVKNDLDAKEVALQDRLGVGVG